MSQKMMQIYACTSIACLFGGLWAGDALALTLIEQSSTGLYLRIITFVFYGIFFGIIVFSGRHGRRNNRRFLMISCIVSLILYGIGTAFFFMETESFFGIALMLTKTVGGPLSAGLMCFCATINREAFPRVALIGLLGAFITKAVLIWTISKGFSTPFFILLVACGFVFFAFFICVAPFIRTMAPFLGENSHAQKDTLLTPIKRPANKLLTTNLVIGMIVASMMLGYLRSGIVGPDPHALRLVFFTLVVIVVLGSKLPVRMTWVFNGATICTAAGFLLGPSLAFIILDAPAALCGIGSTLFETVMLVLVVWVTRNCTDPVRGAAGGLLVVISGHLCGAAIASIALSIFGEGLAFRESSLIIVFFYVIMLVFLFRSTSLHLPFLPQTFSDLEDNRAPSEDENEVVQENEPPCIIPQTEAETTAPSKPPHAEEDDDRYWTQPCLYTAKTYKLTPRETEVLEQLARGRDLSSMEEKFTLSRNTVKMHVKHVYTKLDVHSKQEVIDLVDEARKIV
ncbi:MAG: helix-turn-helix transcriptional regulator [Raoultibacter sp.]